METKNGGRESVEGSGNVVRTLLGEFHDRLAASACGEQYPRGNHHCLDASEGRLRARGVCSGRGNRNSQGSDEWTRSTLVRIPPNLATVGDYSGHALERCPGAGTARELLARGFQWTVTVGSACGSALEREPHVTCSRGDSSGQLQ